jgi:hypothetical protein
MDLDAVKINFHAGTVGFQSIFRTRPERFGRRSAQNKQRRSRGMKNPNLNRNNKQDMAENRFGCVIAISCPYQIFVASGHPMLSWEVQIFPNNVGA